MLCIFSFANKFQSLRSPHVQGTLIRTPVIKACHGSSHEIMHTGSGVCTEWVPPLLKIYPNLLLSLIESAARQNLMNRRNQCFSTDAAAEVQNESPPRLMRAPNAGEQVTLLFHSWLLCLLSSLNTPTASLGSRDKFHLSLIMWSSYSLPASTSTLNVWLLVRLSTGSQEGLNSREEMPTEAKDGRNCNIRMQQTMWDLWHFLYCKLLPSTKSAGLVYDHGNLKPICWKTLDYYVIRNPLPRWTLYKTQISATLEQTYKRHNLGHDSIHWMSECLLARLEAFRTRANLILKERTHDHWFQASMPIA